MQQMQNANQPSGREFMHCSVCNRESADPVRGTPESPSRFLELCIEWRLWFAHSAFIAVARDCSDAASRLGLNRRLRDGNAMGFFALWQ